MIYWKRNISRCLKDAGIPRLRVSGDGEINNISSYAMSGRRNKLIAFNYFGGKFTYVDKLQQYFPIHFHFIDVFMGSMVVTLNKRPSNIDTANDINGDIVNFFRVLREQPEELISLLELTPVAREEFNNSWDMTGISNLERARRFYVRIRQSFCGMGAQRKNKGWHMVKTQSRCKMGETVSRWRNAIEKLWPVIERLKSIQIENRDFREIIPVLDSETSFFYCDPPYHKEARCSFNDYMFEFSNKDHEDLAELLHGIQGKAMISGYDCKSMRELYSGWYIVKFPVKFNNIRSTQAQECIWMNYDPDMECQRDLKIQFD